MQKHLLKIKVMKKLFLILFSVLGFSQNIALDPTFGNNGSVVTDIDTLYGSGIRCLLTTNDNKI